MSKEDLATNQGLSSTATFYPTNVITFYLNGKVKISEGILLGVLPECKHCLKIGDQRFLLTEQNNTLLLKKDDFILSFSFEKRDGRYMLKELQNEELGLLRFISTSQQPAIITPHPDLQLLAENNNCHQDVIYIFKKGSNCKLQYTARVTIPGNKRLAEVTERYEDNIVLSSGRFALERNS